MGNSSALISAPLTKSAESLDVKLIESVNLLMEKLQQDFDWKRYYEMMFAMSYGIAQNPGRNIMWHASKSVLDYVDVHHPDLYGFLQNTSSNKNTIPRLFFPRR